MILLLALLLCFAALPAHAQLASLNQPGDTPCPAHLPIYGSALNGAGDPIPSCFPQLTNGSVLFAGTVAGASGGIAQDNAQLFWDDSGHQFAIGSTAPHDPFWVHLLANGDVGFRSNGAPSIEFVNDARSAYVAGYLDGNPLNLNVISGGNVVVGSLSGCVQASAGVLSGTGAACSGASGTVNSGTSGQMAWYAATGTAVSGNANVTSDGSGDLTLGGFLVANGTGTSTFAGAVTVSGVLTASSQLAVNSTVNVNGSAGVNCSAGTLNTATAVVKNGFITHC